MFTQFFSFPLVSFFPPSKFQLTFLYFVTQLDSGEGREGRGGGHRTGEMLCLCDR